MKQKFDTEKFAKAIKTKRVIELGVGIRDIAAKTKVSTATLSRMENESKADIDNIIKVCNWLKQSVCDFIATSKK